MAFQFADTDPRDGTPYSRAYAKLAFLKIDRRAGAIEVWFNNYPTRADRVRDPVGGKYGQTTYRVVAKPQGAVLARGGPPFDDEALAQLAAMGITVAGTVLTHDGVGTLDPAALAALGVTVLDPPVPSYADLMASIADTVALVDSLIAAHIAANPQPVVDAVTGAACPDGVHTWKVLYVDPVRRTVFLDTDTYRNRDTQAAGRPCGKGRFAIPTAQYDAFLAGTASGAAAAIDAAAFGFARGRLPYVAGDAVDVIDAVSDSA